MDLSNFSLFTHAGCMDGSGASILFQQAGGNKRNITYVSPGDLDEVIAESKAVKNPNRQLLFVDVCPTSDDAVQFLHNRGDFTVIDHHASAARLAGRQGFLIDAANSACGTENFRRWLVGCGMSKFDGAPWQRFAQIIDDHDRWILKEPMSLQMPQMFSLIGQQEFVDRFMDVEKRFVGDGPLYWSPFESEMLHVIKKAQDRRFNRLMDKFFVRKDKFQERDILIGYLISGEVNCSELLHDYLDKHPEIDLACQINLDLNKVSLRSNDRVDIVQFAKQFGGGGHRNSGGHPLPDGFVQRIIEGLHG